MRAIEVTRFGPPEVLRPVEVPDPVPGPGQVLVEVQAAAVVFADTLVRSGTMPGAGPTPFVLGNGVGGAVTALGDGVDPGLLGRPVIGSTGGRGGYAQRALVGTDALIEVPDGVSVPDATALLADGRTATTLVRQAPPRPGGYALVEAAGGGVGTLLVQLAAAAGAMVIAAASGVAKLELAGTLGAHAGVDYSRPDWPERVREVTGGHGVELVFESVGGAVGRAALDLLAPGGRMVVFGRASGTPLRLEPGEAERRGITVIDFFAQPHPPEALRRASVAALDEALAGRLRPVIGQTYPLERAAEAHEAIEARTTTGKTLLLP
ncbi:zinc-binding dehydrogenase [Rugosimonospora africana]|nr:zinc-binding dehydrogenase [Rugosimonospora africana]